MLSSSIRRAVRTTTPSSSSSIPFPTVSATAAKSGLLVTTSRRRGGTQQHQRRYSSSKPPVPPNDGSRPIDTSSQAPAKGVSNNSGSNNSKSAGKSDKKDGSHGGRKASAKSRQASAAILNLPSVPSTQDTPMQDIHLASFFSVHRPISISFSVPPTTNDDAFNSIFESKPTSRRGRTDVLNTLTSALHSMEKAFQGQDDLRHAVTQASISNAEPRVIHLDEVSEEDLHTSIAEFAKRLTPFQPPAAPEPYNPEEDLTTTENNNTTNTAANNNNNGIAVAGNTESNVRTYSTILTIRETAYNDGERVFETYIAPLVSDDMQAPSSDGTTIDSNGNESGKTYIERTINNHNNNNKMYTISVRRQRKLKMKKHKFKKLLRKTRTLRRKLDKA